MQGCVSPRVAAFTSAQRGAVSGCTFDRVGAIPHSHIRIQDLVSGHTSRPNLSQSVSRKRQPPSDQSPHSSVPMLLSSISRILVHIPGPFHDKENAGHSLMWHKNSYAVCS